MNNSLTAISGIRVGHAESEIAPTGVTVALFAAPYTCAVDARGGWPGGYDTESTALGKTFYKKNGVFLSGGDMVGLDSARGIRKFLLEQGNKSLYPLPSVIGANIYDVLDERFFDINYEDLGYQAAANASSKPVDEGNVGVGRGATVGKFLGRDLYSKGGVGSYNIRTLEKFNVACLVVTNSVGNIYDLKKNKIIAGTHNPENFDEFVELMNVQDDYSNNRTFKRSKNNHGATTLAIVATDASLTHEETIRMATVAHDGFARSIRPAHMSNDGDTIFTVSTDEYEITGNRMRVINLLNEAACQCLSEAIVRSVTL